MRIAVFLAAGLTVLAGVLQAQSSDDEDEMDYFPLVPSGNSLRFGLRMVGGPKVSFGHLGVVPSIRDVSDTTTVQARAYDDGTVNVDARTGANGGTVNDGLTNTWNFDYSDQVTTGGDIAFHTYDVTSTGAGMRARAGTAGGWELQFGHRIRKIARKIDLSLVAGFSFTDLDAKVGGTIPAQLNILTDVYSLNGQTPPVAPYGGPTYGSQGLYDANGNPLLGPDGSQQTKSVETTTLLANLPTRTNTTTATDVRGRWQIKGAAYTFRVGPMLEFPLSERLKFNVEAGAALIYVGSRYIVDESVDLEEVETPLETLEEKDHSVFLPAYYIDANAEYWLTERAGFYLGAGYQKSGSFDQTMNDRTARIDLSTTYGIQSGITLRF
ncbi:MAG TPA: hypothetical protein VLW52_10145 [Opitutaceae bacterium]|nr:hypothetical protein [Opitutaceae bacterium]